MKAKLVDSRPVGLALRDKVWRLPRGRVARWLKITVRDYLCSILPGLANFPINRITELTPAAWLARNWQPLSVEKPADINHVYRLEELAPCMGPIRCMHDLGPTDMIVCRVAGSQIRCAR